MLGRRPALQGAQGRAGQVLPVGRQVQLAERAGRVPPHGVRVAFAGRQAPRHGS